MFKQFYIFFFAFLSIFSILFSLPFSNTNSNNLFMKPININTISSNFGYRTLNGKLNFHDGIDYPATINTPIYASKSGVITCNTFLNGYGNTVIILHSDSSKTLYGHLSENFVVKSGQTVSQGETIGYVGPKYLSNGKLNGYTTGPHLHFTIFDANGKQVNPLTLLQN